MMVYFIIITGNDISFNQAARYSNSLSNGFKIHKQEGVLVCLQIRYVKYHIQVHY